ncbi:hypothetical protein RN001_001691 [Aquatica leii]|uniref:Uncharacterized protein n=1 Tax=Aquatica leii TaxID=1421715 RepID=A0AAN7SSP4_9COLE|nr:hypothetical protein RN001_001691 [Aquatica leii]
MSPINQKKNKIQPTTSTVEKENETPTPDFAGYSQSSPPTTPLPEQLEDITPTKKLELSLMTVLRRQEAKTVIQKRSKLRRIFAETLTADDVRLRMIENAKNKRKPTVKKTQKQKSKKPVEKTEETLDSDASLQLVHDTDDDISHDENNTSATEEDNCGKAKEFVKFDGSNQNIVANSWVFVRFNNSKSCVEKEECIHYVGQVLEVNDSEIMVNFLRKKKIHFVYPDVPDQSLVSVDDVAMVLREPYIKRGMNYFHVNFLPSNYKALPKIN